MPKNQYNVPAMEVVEFGKEDAVCTLSTTDTTDFNGNKVDTGINPGIGSWDGSGFES